MLGESGARRREYYSEPTLINTQHNQIQQDILSPPDVEDLRDSHISKFNCRDGPTLKQTATDCHCTAIYLFLTFLSLVSVLLFQKYSIQGFQNPFDHTHKPCQSHQMLLLTPSTPPICVLNCPTRFNIRLICSDSTPPSLCPQSTPYLKLNQQLSLCFQPPLTSTNISVPSLTRVVRGVNQHSIVIVMVLVFVLVYSGLMLFTNILLANSIVYVWIGITESAPMIMSSCCFYRYYTLTPHILHTSPFQYKHKHYLLVLGIIFGFVFLLRVLSLVNKKGQLKYIVDLIKLSKVVFLDNFYLSLVIVAQLIISLGVLYLHLKIIYIGLSFGYIQHSKSDPYNQIQPHSVRYFLFPLSLFVFIWTFLICLNSFKFLLSCITIQWYFNQKLQGEDYPRLSNLKQSLKLLYIHFGTVCYASLLSILPRWLFKCINLIKHQYPSVSSLSLFTLPIFSCCKYLSVYSHTYVILRSHEFNRANKQCCSLLDNVKSDSPQLHDLGDYYSRSSISFFTLFSLGFSYYAIMLKHSQNVESFSGLIPSILICMAGTVMITFILLNHLGLVGDILVMMYQLDKLESHNQPLFAEQSLSIPLKLLEVMRHMDQQHL